MEALLEETLPEAASGEPVLTVGDVAYYFFPEGIIAELENGPVLVCSTPFGIASRVVNPETGESWFRVQLLSDPPRGIYSPTAKGPSGIVRALQDAGEFVRGKLLTPFVEEALARNWRSLPVRSIDQEEELADTAPSAASIYEYLLEYIRDNVEKFDDETWGRLAEGPEKGVAVLTRPVMANFFQKVAVPKEQQPRIMRYWRDRGWLHVEIRSDGTSGRFTRKETVQGVRRRAYVISLPAGEDAVAE